MYLPSIRSTLFAVVLLASGLSAQETAIPRTASGTPDLSGNYSAATLTPLNRPPQFGDKLYMTREEAEAIAREEREFQEQAVAASDPDRAAPKAGGAPPAGAPELDPMALGAGNVGGYNFFWIDRGTDAFEVDGKFRTSIIYDPENGRQPAMTPAAMRRMMANLDSYAFVNDGTAKWLDQDGEGPFDGPESLALAERCLLSFASGAPILPGLYNNHKTIVQTEDRVMILNEMVHHARVVRLDEEHAPESARFWLGDSIGSWDGDTLVIDTTNFRSPNGLYGADENLHLVERLTLQADGNLRYDFTVEDPSAWSEPWSGELVLRGTDEKVFEYACHEGNYAMGNVLRGARLLEEEYRSGASGGD